MKLEYIVIVPDEPGAGITGFLDNITVEIAYASPDQETLLAAEAHFKQAIEEWFDGGRVYAKKDFLDWGPPE